MDEDGERRSPTRELLWAPLLMTEAGWRWSTSWLVMAAKVRAVEVFEGTDKSRRVKSPHML